MTFDYFTGISVAPPVLSICAPGCDCRMRYALDLSVQMGISACGFRIADTASSIVKRSPEPRGLKSHRTIRTLLEWTAASLRPPSQGGCVTGGPMELHSGGLSAYTFWEGIEESFESTYERVRLWAEVRTNGAAFLYEIAGKQSSRFANLLRRAAACYEAEAALWNGYLLNVETAPSVQTSDVLDRASSLAEEAAMYVAEASLTAAHLPTELISALIDFRADPPSGALLNEVIYVARAGARPLRELAARSLGGMENPAARSALIQLLYDSDGRIAGTALFGLLHQPYSRISRALESAIKHGDRAREYLDYPFSWPLLAAYAAAAGTKATESLLLLKESLETEEAEAGLSDDIDLFCRLLIR